MRIRLLVGTIALTLVGAGTSSAAPPPPAGAAKTSHPGDRVTLTLVTGDRVTLRGKAVEKVAPGRGRADVQFRRYTISGDLYVVPSDAGRLLATGEVDEQLFNVTQQLEWRYDDAHRRDLPLLAQQSTTGSRTAAKQATVTRSLGAAGLDALTVAKSDAASFWAGLDTAPDTRTQGSGVRRLWLDGKVEASLDTSVPHIGAPKAWARGYTGRGVDVAVLDTGYDRKHPDLKKVVTQTKGFTDEGADDVQDDHGHGTHVASTVAGSGAASDGAYKGVAPGAHLAVGKVLDSWGFGQLSWIVAGMEGRQGTRTRTSST